MEPQPTALLTIGQFAHAARLSHKALRLYDEQGLLCPASVDPLTGYRRYAPAQLERARLVAWLRRLGMPLARIREVCESYERAPAEAAAEVRAYWARVEADTAARRELAAFLVDQLARKEPDAMTTPAPTPEAPLHLRYAALSDAGLVRETNQDCAYADAELLAVADGFGNRGAPASDAAVQALRRLDLRSVPAGDLLNVLDDAVRRAGQAVRDAAEPALRDAGTTLTALLWTGSQLALVHIGDTRAYLLRDGELFQITHDHTYVQSLVDEGRLAPEEAASHPQRALLLRALEAHGDEQAGPDLALHDVRAGDRYLLCSDGLSTVIPADEVATALAAPADPTHTARTLIASANAAGGPDNVSCVVAEVVAESAEAVADVPETAD